VVINDANSDLILGVANLKPNAEGDYLIAKESSKKTLIEVTATLHFAGGNTQDYTKVLYLYRNNFYPDKMQAVLFGNNVRTKVVSKDMFVNVTELGLPDNFENEVTMETKFFDGYGYAIQLNYSPLENYLVQVEFRQPGKDWVVATNNRPGMYNFYHIHGNTLYNKLLRNVAIGPYEFRMKYLLGLNGSKWYYGKGEVANYEGK
jgi:hypothetical protein